MYEKNKNKLNIFSLLIKEYMILVNILKFHNMNFCFDSS